MGVGESLDMGLSVGVGVSVSVGVGLSVDGERRVEERVEGGVDETVDGRGESVAELTSVLSRPVRGVWNEKQDSLIRSFNSV